MFEAKPVAFVLLVVVIVALAARAACLIRLRMDFWVMINALLQPDR